MGKSVDFHFDCTTRMDVIFGKTNSFDTEVLPRDPSSPSREDQVGVLSTLATLRIPERAW